MDRSHRRKTSVFLAIGPWNLGLDNLAPENSYSRRARAELSERWSYIFFIDDE